MSARAAVAALLALTAGCDGCGPPEGEPQPTFTSTPPPATVASGRATAAAPDADVAPSLPASELTWQFADTPAGALDVVIHLPPRRQGERFPVLLAFHGRGEAMKGPKRGARGWVDDYWLPRAEQRLFAPPLASTDLQRLVPGSRLDEMNEALAARPYRGLIVVCPYTPDILAGTRSLDAASAFGGWLTQTLVPRVRRETPALESRGATGIDGVSLGGRLSVLVGLEHPGTFGVVAGLQAAFDSAEAPELGRRAREARDRHPFVLRLLSSEGDFFLRATRSIGRALAERSIEHRLDVVPGPHDYDFNRGPGVYEMLLFHDRALRGERYEL